MKKKMPEQWGTNMTKRTFDNIDPTFDGEYNTLNVTNIATLANVRITSYLTIPYTAQSSAATNQNPIPSTWFMPGTIITRSFAANRDDTIPATTTFISNVSTALGRTWQVGEEYTFYILANNTHATNSFTYTINRTDTSTIFRRGATTLAFTSVPALTQWCSKLSVVLLTATSVLIYANSNTA